jgi:magnesium-transporting ATPase (P-type)
MSFSQYTNRSSEEILIMLRTPIGGLSEKEVVLRQKTVGYNEVKSKSINAFQIFSRQLKLPFSYLLLSAAVVSFFVGEKIDFIVITCSVSANILISFFQEYKAEKAILLLRKFVSQNVKVLRHGRKEIIDKKDVVPGDIVFVEAGDKIPADLRVIKVDNFLIDESSLTGESIPVLKISEALKVETGEIYKAKNMLFSGTTVVSGKAQGIVVNTGKNTTFGDIQAIVSSSYKQSTYEKSIIYFSKLMLKIVLVTIILLFAANIVIKGYGVFLQLLLFSVALIVSILPEGLPAVISFSLARGSLDLAKRHVVVRRLSAVEDLGNIEILCTDKTGTLTENKLSLQKIVSSNKRKCLLYGLLNSDLNNQKQSILNPFDLALFEKSPEDFWHEFKNYELLYELPFDSYRMRSSFTIKDKGGNKFLIVKGAPATR